MSHSRARHGILVRRVGNHRNLPPLLCPVLGHGRVAHGGVERALPAEGRGVRADAHAPRGAPGPGRDQPDLPAVARGPRGEVGRAPGGRRAVRGHAASPGQVLRELPHRNLVLGDDSVPEENRAGDFPRAERHFAPYEPVECMRLHLVRVHFPARHAAASRLQPLRPLPLPVLPQLLCVHAHASACAGHHRFRTHQHLCDLHLCRGDVRGFR
mmetsp:Transcript_37705/g.88318  ORF Transcript_37705/g.88318 Transcript_37705/m.88318 type:complete len:212 (+) Transcript_37705:766-1401(+)